MAKKDTRYALCVPNYTRPRAASVFFLNMFLLADKNNIILIYFCLFPIVLAMENVFTLLESYNYPLKSGLIYKNEFTFLVAIILSAQSRDSFVNTQTVELFEEYDSAEKMVELGEGLFRYIRKIGLWRNKGKNILSLAQQIVGLKSLKSIKNWYDSFLDKSSFEDDLTLYGPILSKEGIPSFRSGLLYLRGVGRKSANVFLNVIYNAPVFPVDTHVIRVSNRLGLVSSLNPIQIEKDFMEIIPEQYKNKIAHYLVWHGRNVCEAKQPKCKTCKLKNYCNFFKSKCMI